MRKIFLIGFSILVIGIVIGYALRYPIFDFQRKPVVSEPPGRESENLPTHTSFAVIIENAPEARPQAGLREADVVIETLAEGGITRYLAIFRSREASQIGPVRSARPYFLEWILGFSMPVAFSGGSQEALEMLADEKLGLRAINEFYNEQAFWRDNTRPTPHNLFTSTERLGEVIKNRNWDSERLRESRWGWDVKREVKPLPEAVPVKDIFVDFSFGLFEVSYKYNLQTNVYERFLGGKAHADGATGEQLVAKNVVVLYTTSRLLDQKLLTIDLETLGSGRALIFRDGQVVQARWRKNAVAEPLRIVDADGSLVALNDGPTWIAVVDQEGNVSWK